MNLEAKIKRHGYHLMSMASVGMFCVGLATLLLATLPWISHDIRPSGTLEILGFDVMEFMQAGANVRWAFTLTALCVGFAYFLPFGALRRLGHSLYHYEALTLPVANAFRLLAHSILACLLLQALPDMSLGFISGLLDGSGASTPARPPSIEHGFDIGATYITVIACLCLYSVSHLMKLAAEAADDSRSIV